MPFDIGAPEVLLILVIVLVVFGAGRLPEVFGQLGKGIRTFRDESAGVSTSASTPASRSCATCGASLPPAAKFCPSCGAAA